MAQSPRAKNRIPQTTQEYREPPRTSGGAGGPCPLLYAMGMCERLGKIVWLVAVLVVLWPLPGGTSAQPAGGLESLWSIGNAEGRSVLRLDGPWDAIVDPYDTGSLDYKSRPLHDGFWADRKPAGPMDLVEYDFDASDKLTVPGDWNTQRESLYFYEGTVWYRNVFASEPSPGMRRFIRVGSANQRSAVWLNGQMLGENPVGFTPRSYEVTDAIREGDNSLVVRVNNRREPSSVPGMRTDWWNYGGLTRPVELLEVPATFVRDAHAELTQDRVKVSGWVALDGPEAASRRVRVSVGGSAVEFTTDAAGVAQWELARGGLGLWSPSSPELHELRAELLGLGAGTDDVFTDRIGLRTIATEGGRVLLNGEAIGFRGVCVHEERIAGDGRSWSEGDARELAEELRALGCNFVRLAHYPHAEAVARVMDEAGIMVWAEIPVYWKLDYANPETLSEARSHLQGLISRDHNRASVVVWSIGNETEVNEASNAFRSALAEDVRRLDPHRLLAAALEPRLTIRDGRVVKVVLDDPFGAEVDLLAINSYIGWYVGRVEDMRGLPVELGWDKPIMVSEFGADAKRGLAPKVEGRDEIWTEAYQAKLYRETLAWFETMPNFAGCSPWILSDFRSPRRLLPGVQDHWNRKGLLDELGEPKEAYEVVRGTYERWAKEWPWRP